MGSLGHDKENKELVITQVSFGGFDRSISAKELVTFLEDEIGMIDRCRLKTSWTPPGSFPSYNFRISPGMSESKDTEVPPHAFVHFALPDAAQKAIDAAGQSKLIYNGKLLKVNSGIDSSFKVSRRKAVAPFQFSGVGVDIGTLYGDDEFWVSWKAPDSGVDFHVDPFDECCKILFSRKTAFSFKDTKQVAIVECNFKIEFLVRDINWIKSYVDSTAFVTIFRLSASPYLYYRTADDDFCNPWPFAILDDEDPWIRTTDFTCNGTIGRCDCYRIVCPPRFGLKLQKALAYMKQRRIPEYTPKSLIMIRNEPQFGLNISDPFFCIQNVEGVGFQTVFLVNAVLHKGIFSQHQLSEEFYDLLRNQSSLINEESLRCIWSYKQPVFDACQCLKRMQEWLYKNPKLIKRSKMSDDNIEIRRLVVTPTRAYCLPPEVELSNRVLRHYKHVADRFLRVTFTDEGMQPLYSHVLNYYAAPIVKDITSKSFKENSTIFRRVQSLLKYGFHISGRKYSFLAFSSNQLRDRSAWFIAEGNDLRASADAIRKWMGRFEITNVAKCAARMGQCFSSTYATINMPSKEVDFKLPDVKRTKYVFSDGIGKISPDLAMEVAEKLELSECPSAYQIRYAGCKGVVAVWPRNDSGIRLSLRPSMKKFESKHTVLEVATWTHFQPCYLNRQIITLLSCLNVPDSVFARMQDLMVGRLNKMMIDVDTAYEVLTTSCPDHGNTAALMLSAGYNPQSEPHLRSMLQSVKSAQFRDLLEKTRIFVSKGRWLMGCLDELGLLEYGQCFIQSSVPSLENCFAKHGPRFAGNKSDKQVIVGAVVIAKNPCLHPGDIRILEAVDVPDLHHLVDCLVFPQNGHRPHPDEASGSDLDGDVFFVTWDEDLIPPGKESSPPMDYSPAEAKSCHRQITTSDLIEFFAKIMVNENIGPICNAHVVHADLSEDGALDEKCLQLAELAAIAVDFPKTGKTATMPPSLRPKIYPDFMEKEKNLSYRSEKILGRLYRKIKDVFDEEVSFDASCIKEDLPYDEDLDIPGASEYIIEAWENKCSYDAQLNALLGQYQLHSEGEIVTGHFCSMPKYNSKKLNDLKDRLKHAYSGLHKEYRSMFEAMGTDFHKLSEDEKCALYEKKASAWYKVTYHPHWLKESHKMKESEGDLTSPRLSFAWIATDYLVRIKLKNRERKEFDGKKPINHVAKYLSERIL